MKSHAVNSAVTICCQTCCEFVNPGMLQTCWNDLVTTWQAHQIVNKLCQQAWNGLLHQACSELVVTACYKSASQQVVTSLMMTSLLQVDKRTTSLQLVDKLATSLFSQQLVNKMWDFYVCTILWFVLSGESKLNCYTMWYWTSFSESVLSS